LGYSNEDFVGCSNALSLLLSLILSLTLWFSSTGQNIMSPNGLHNLESSVPLNHSILNIFIVVSSTFSGLCVWNRDNRGIPRNSIEKNWINQRLTLFFWKSILCVHYIRFFFLKTRSAIITSSHKVMSSACVRSFLTDRTKTVVLKKIRPDSAPNSAPKQTRGDGWGGGSFASTIGL